MLKHEDVNLLEIFYDLFFAANYNVFSQNQTVTNHQRFKAYIGYFSLLWGTWFVVTLFDVRFVTDSIFGKFFFLFCSFNTAVTLTYDLGQSV
jgi:hypothetical protein